MERLSLAAVTRAALGKNAVKKIRRDGLVPAILYGQAREPRPLAVARKDLLGVLATGGRNALIDLRIARNGDEETSTVMVSEVQRDPIRRDILHVDLHEISLTERLEARVPIVLTGTPEGVASGAGILEQHLREAVVRCLPTQIPDRLTVDVAGLGVGDSLHVRDLPVEEGIEVLTPPEEVIAAVVAPEEEEAPAAAAPEGVAEPEVVGRTAVPAEGEAKAQAAPRPEAKPARPEAKPARSEKKE
jgi:large subunit ribosomal protein L25